MHSPQGYKEQKRSLDILISGYKYINYFNDNYTSVYSDVPY